MKILQGVIQENGSVLGDDGSVHRLPVRGRDREGYPEVLIDATHVGGAGVFARQSIKPFIGLKVQYNQKNKDSAAYNFIIL